MNKPLFTGSEWTFDLIEKTWNEIDRIGKDVFNLDYHPPQIEIISAEQMLDAYSSVAMPVMYNHWSFGKKFMQEHESYTSGKSGLAYEVVINTNPTLAYLMENNTMTMQTLVLAHAVCGHGSFFKNNYLFQEWTKPEAILDYLVFAKDYINECEYKYGEHAVERILDACHSLQYYGIDKYKRGTSQSKDKLTERKQKWRDYLQESINPEWDTDQLTKYSKDIDRVVYQLSQDRRTFPEENLLYFVEKYSPVLDEWEREVVRIVRKVAQYFYPQMQTQLMNEGWATFWHYTIMQHMHETGLLSDGSYLEFLQSHTNVITQPYHDSQFYGGINVYALGFAMFQDLRRICENPDDEDRYWFPTLAGTKDWVGALQEIAALYRDESFVLQYLSPKVIRKFRLFTVSDDELDEEYLIKSVQSEEDVLDIRESLSKQYSLTYRLPQVEVTGVDWEDTRALELTYKMINGRMMDTNTCDKTVDYLGTLWGYPVLFDLEEINDV